MGMTREEAKSYIGELKMYANSQGWDEEYQIACNVAMNELEQEPTTKNDLGVDCVARQDVERFIEGFINEYTPEEELEFINLELNGLKHLPSVTPQEPQTFKWCTDCKEYDQEKHCCHRWSKVIRDTVEEIKQEQEPILDKIRAEIEFEVDHRTNMLCAEDVFAILDKYKAEIEPQESEG